MSVPWEPDPTTDFRKRWGKSARELGHTTDDPRCPDIWELESGDVAVIGRDFTEVLGSRLPAGVTIGADERLVVIPRDMIVSAKSDIPDV
ncbi:hypothetical protein [Streptomyces sp. SID3343]|uniref:hypothetical protein n=1 Tax=Streptomyces sp. SID3343 TaxID=2690260 RepID=UPI00136B3C61|nr:hypothetical protein [Streptomyces sp. SID3343]MYW05480.1 hypothetical protein [Streptomyces sp. SID3343]